MKTIGLIGGMSWESTAVYYRLINEGVREQLGGLHSAPLLLHSFDFDAIIRLQKQGRWDEAAYILGQAARGLEAAGADVIAICTNTMHKVADDVQAQVSVPLMHIADVTRQAVTTRGLKTVALLGTRYTMEQEFLRARLGRSGVRVLVPEEAGRDRVHSIIFDELCCGEVRPGSRTELVAMIADLAQMGAEGVVLGCTELMLLLTQHDCPLPLFDTTAIHVEALIAYALTADSNAFHLPPVALSDYFAVAI